MTRSDAPGPEGRTIVIDDGQLDPYREELESLDSSPPSRLAFAALHVVMRESYEELSHSPSGPGNPDEIADFIDWHTTGELRRTIDGLGFGVAEAMDTAQRFAIGWPAAARLIRQCEELGLRQPFMAGAGVDHLAETNVRSDLVEGVLFQIEEIRRAGGWPIVLPLLWLARHGNEADYVDVYGEIIRGCDGPLFIHWLGESFLAELRGYFPGESFARIVALDPDKVRGVKLSLLDDELEVRVRRELLGRGQIVLTGDDFHFGRLIAGGSPGEDLAPIQSWGQIGDQRVALGDFSHALLGILDGVAEPASLALRFLGAGAAEPYFDLMRPCEELARWIFKSPTQHYKSGLAFLAWLNGWQNNPMLANREDRARDLAHHLRLVELANEARALRDAELAAERLHELVEDAS